MSCTVANSAIQAAALELVHRHSLDEIEGALVAAGWSTELAAKAVRLIPSAFAAFVFEREGIIFPAEFQVGPPGALRTIAYASEPIHAQAKRLAADWHKEGRASLINRVLDWSAEASAIRDARARGLTPAKMSQIHHGEQWA